MPLVQAKCTNCGANIQVDNTKDTAICPSCGTTFIVEKAITNHNMVNSISANVVNVYGGSSGNFVVRGGALENNNGDASESNEDFWTNIAGNKYVSSLDVEKIHNPADFFRAISDASNCIANQFDAFSESQDDKSQDDIEKICRALGADSLITEMIKRGTPAIVEAGLLTDTYLSTFNGMRFDRGLASPYFSTTDDSSMAVLQNPAVLLSSGRINGIQDILPLLEGIVKNAPAMPLLIVAPDWDDQTLSTLVVNKKKGTITSVLVRAPGFGDRRTEILKDIAALTGTRVFPTPEQGLRDVTVDMLGRATKIRVTKDETIIVGGYVSEEKIEERIKDIEHKYELATSDWDREKLKERMDALKKGVTVLEVGGASESEIKKKTEEYSKLLNQVQDAVKNGLPSDFASYMDLAMINLNEKVLTASNDEKIGIEMIQGILNSIKKQALSIGNK